MEKNSCSFRKMTRDSLETSVKVVKHPNKTQSLKSWDHSFSIMRCNTMVKIRKTAKLQVAIGDRAWLNLISKVERKITTCP